MAKLLATAALGLLLSLSACGGDDDGDDGTIRACAATTPSSAAWRGNAEADRATGGVEVAPFNRYLEGADPEINRSPCNAARVFLHLDRPQGEGTTVDLAVEPENSAEATVTVTLDHLPDDSVAAERWILEFEPGAGDMVRLVRARVAYRCQQGRGHQDFSTRLCI
jgi:hypothetical protein